MTNKVLKSLRSLFPAVSLALMVMQSALPLLSISLSTPTSVQAQSSSATQLIPLSAISFKLNEEHNFEFSAPTTTDVPIVIVYTNGEQQEAIRATATINNSIASTSIYAGTCSGNECTPHEITSGELILPDQNQTFVFTVRDGQTWLQEGSKAVISSVGLNTTYRAPQNNQVEVVFTKLPDKPGKLMIEEVQLTPEQVETLGAVSATAYDITSDMENGSFAYDLQLPLPEDAPAANQVIFAEHVTDLQPTSIQPVSIEKVEIDNSKNTVSISDLDHFTVFVVTSFEEVQTTSATIGYNTTWFANGGSTVTQVASGTHGITSSDGNHHAEITGYAFTRWDGYKNVFPTGGYDTRVDVYIDTSLADGSADKRFNYTSAVNTPTGSHRRDFIFHLGTNPTTAGQWNVSVSNNSPGWPGNPDRSPVSLTDSGWYTLEHQFQDNGLGVLSVTMNIYKKSDNSLVGSWTLSDPTDIIGSTVGGNRYGWFVGNAPVEFGFDWLAIDAAEIEYDSLPINHHSVIVRPSDLQGWTPTTTMGGQVEFVTTGDAPSGAGTLNLTTQNDNQDRASITRTEDVLLSNLDHLSYKTKRPTGFQAEGNAAYRLLIDADGDNSTTTDHAYLVFEPYWQNGGIGDAAPVAYGTWQTWDVKPGVFWASIPGGNSVSGLVNGAGGPPFYSLQDVVDSHPNARVIGLSIGIGSYNLNYDIEVDDVQFSYKTETSTESYIYNFEPNPNPVVTIDPTSLQAVNNIACGIGNAWDNDGLTVNIENWNSGYVLQGRYFVAGGSFSGWFDLSPWGTFTVTGDDATFFAGNTGDSPAGAAGWEIRVVDSGSQVISNIDSLNYTISTDPVSAACGGMEITLCKEDIQGNPLPGWTLLLSGREPANQQTLNANSSVGVSFTPANPGYYQLVTNGIWNNGSHESRDAIYGASGINQGNLNPINTGVYDERIVKLVLNDAPSNLLDFTSWWGAYNPAHEYATVLESDGSPITAKIWDYPIGSNNPSWYSDNTGALTLNWYELTDAQTVTTGENGCGTLSGITPGDYYLSELPQSGWQYISGAGEVTVGPENDTFTVVNQSLLTEPEPELSQVTVCKEDQDNNSLSGWQTLLYDSTPVQSVAVPSNGSSVSLSSIPAGDYVLRAEGQYTYRSTVDTEYSDAGWSKRLPSDPVYIAGPFAPWVNVNTFGSPYTGYLGVRVNGDANWGDYFNPAHIYARSLEGYAGGTLNLEILDDQYTDNSGSVMVGLHNGYTGLTSENGCVTFDDVPYGDYTLDEINQLGWENISGLGSVTIDEPEYTFTIVNAHENTEEPEPTPDPSPSPSPTPTPSPTILSASKVVCSDESLLPNNAFGGSITANTATDFVAQHSESCYLDTNWQFQWAPSGAGTFGEFQTSTSSLGEPWQTFTASSLVQIEDISSVGGRIEVRELFPESGEYIPFSNGGNVSAELWCSNDGATYDNWEWINNPQQGETYYCVAFNATQENIEPTPSPSPSVSPQPSPTVSPNPSPTPESSPEVLGTTTSSNFSAPGPASPPVCTDPQPGSAPTVTAVGGVNSVTLSWSPISPATHYAVFITRLSDGAQYGADNIGNVTSYTVNNLAGGEIYNFQVMAVNGCQPGDRSNTISPAVGGGPVIGGPVGPAGEVLGSQTDEEQNETPDNSVTATDNQVLGITDENCENPTTPYLPIIFLIALTGILFVIELFVRQSATIKTVITVAVSLAAIALFYWLRNCNCTLSADTFSRLIGILCQWFWVVAIIVALLTRSFGQFFVRYEE